jgi:adenine-specific DNA methylase
LGLAILIGSGYKGRTAQDITDPPYDASIQYGELSYMWVSWLKMNNDYLENIVSNEIIRNERQHKDFAVYHSLLSASFQKMFKVLKPNHYLTLTFRA